MGMGTGARNCPHHPQAGNVHGGQGLKRIRRDRQIMVYTDGSTHGIGADLAQIDEDGVEYMCACMHQPQPQ